MPAFGVSLSKASSFLSCHLFCRATGSLAQLPPREETQTQKQSLLPTAPLNLPGLLLTFLGQHLPNSPAAFPRCLHSARAAVFCKKYF